jgi:hypothetical protein
LRQKIKEELLQKFNNIKILKRREYSILNKNKLIKFKDNIFKSNKEILTLESIINGFIEEINLNNIPIFYNNKFKNTLKYMLKDILLKIISDYKYSNQTQEDYFLFESKIDKLFNVISNNI